MGGTCFSREMLAAIERRLEEQAQDFDLAAELRAERALSLCPVCQKPNHVCSVCGLPISCPTLKPNLKYGICHRKTCRGKAVVASRLSGRSDPKTVRYSTPDGNRQAPAADLRSLGGPLRPRHPHDRGARRRPEQACFDFA